MSRLTATTKIRIFDNSTPSSSRTAFDAKGLAYASPRRLCFQPSKAGCIPMFAQLRGVMLHLAFVPANLADFLNNNLCCRCSNWGERNVSTTHRASATIGTTYAAARLRIQGSRVTICNIFNFCIFADKFLFCTMQVMEITLGRQKRLHNDTLTKNVSTDQDLLVHYWVLHSTALQFSCCDVSTFSLDVRTVT